MRRLRDKRVWAGVGVLLAGVLVFLRTLTGEDLAGMPTCQATKGAFQVTLLESGELQAARGEKISTPRIEGGDLKIVHLWPEGEKVAVGDLLLQFDKTELENNMRYIAGELEKSEADLSKGQAAQEQQLSQLESGIAQQDATLELAQLKLKQTDYGTPYEKAEAEIGLGQAQRALEQAKRDFEARKLINRVELAKLQLSITQAQKNYDRAKSDYDRLSVFATRPGILVYEKVNRGGGRMEKVKVGDNVWGNMTLLSLPDLEAMQVLAKVGEIDITRIQPGQPVLIRLDAFPGPVFHGQVAQVAPMANPDMDAPNVQVFALVVDIKEQDDRLRPGMSASIEIVIDTVPDALSVPLEALREERSHSLVYRREGRGLEPVHVRVGKRNAVAAVIDSGLEEGAVLALKPPAQNEE
ncbi:MAG: HlyD family efflux transporter periplasmic adaptor subunit [Candidatus Latescibacteria bacterium]|nr:HlyD family efflux transporter periplasmic adaptor subunit [Candidatus Latescibacterota bacterium]